MRRGPAVFLFLCLLAAAGYGAGRIMSAGSDTLTHFAPAHVQAAKPASGSTPLAQRMLLVLVDGLRPSDAVRLPALDYLARQGATFSLAVPAPGHGAPGMATLFTGAGPRIHGVSRGSDTVALATDSIPTAAARAGVTVAGTGSPALGAFLQPLVGQWQTVESLAQFREQAGPLLAPGGPRLAILQIDHLRRESRRLRTADPEDAFYRLALSQVDAELIRLLELVDLETTALLVVGINPADPAGAALPGGPVPLVMAGAGIRENYRGQGSLEDVAPTVSAILGTAVPVANRGRPLLAGIEISAGRPTDVVMQRVMESRQVYAQAALLALGAPYEAPLPPEQSADADAYFAELDQLIRSAGFAAWKDRLIAIAPYAAGVLLAVLLYLALAWKAQFGLPIFLGSLAYVTLFHAVFFLTGGRYSAAFQALDAPGGPLRTVGLQTAAALVPSLLLVGYLLSRKGFKKRSYVGGAACHFALSTALLVALPVGAAVALKGWEFPVELPAPGLQVWFLVACMQVMVIGYLSPVWAMLTISAASLSRRLWPVREQGDPERNADNVVRLKALRRGARR